MPQEAKRRRPHPSYTHNAAHMVVASRPKWIRLHSIWTTTIMTAALKNKKSWSQHTYGNVLKKEEKKNVQQFLRFISKSSKPCYRGSASSVYYLQAFGSFFFEFIIFKYLYSFAHNTARVRSLLTVCCCAPAEYILPPYTNFYSVPSALLLLLWCILQPAVPNCSYL